MSHPSKTGTDWTTLPEKDRIEDVEYVWQGKYGSSPGSNWPSDVVKFIRQTDRNLTPQQRTKLTLEFVKKRKIPMLMFISKKEFKK